MWLFLLGWIALIFGALLIFSPNALLRLSGHLNQMVTKIDEQVMAHRLMIGLFLIASSLFFFVTYYLWGLKLY